MWLDQALSDAVPVLLPWQSVAAFLCVATNPRLAGSRFTMEQAAAVVDSWLDQPNLRLAAPGERHWPLLREMLVEGQARGPLVSGAQLAALAIECGGVRHATGRDFARFPGLRWLNPLKSPRRRRARRWPRRGASGA